MSEALRLAREAQSIFDAAEQKDRGLNSEERLHVESLLERAGDAKNLEVKLREIGQELGPPGPVSTDPGRPFNQTAGGPGDRFVESAGYKAIKDPTSRPQTWSSGLVEVTTGGPDLEMKGTLLESTAGGPGGGLVPPFYQPGVVSKLFEYAGVADLFGQSQTTGSQVRYAVEGTATSGAAGVAEAAAKPESTLSYSETTEAVRKIATVLPVSDEMLEDAPSIQAYLNGRLSLFVRIEEERQLLRGSGGGSNELTGIFGRSGINTYSKLAADDNAVSLARVIANTAGSSQLQPDGIILHPSNWLTTRLLRDGTGGTAGNFYASGPFGPSGNNAGAAGLFGQSLWGVPVVLSTNVGLGTALVGSFREGAHIWRRGGLSVEASNSHSDYFIRNLTALRAEERLALGCYRPAAFTAVSGLT